VPCATGSTNLIDHWAPTKINYVYCVNAMNLVLNPSDNSLNNLNICGGVLWNQGESSIRPTLDSDYVANFVTMMNGFITEIYGMSANTPIVVAKIGGNQYASDATGDIHRQSFINEQLQILANTYTNIACVDAMGLETDDKVHYNAESMDILGHRYYDKYCEAYNL
ncbi:unnamed protein product, partial [Ectocarpus fasciculatus]